METTSLAGRAALSSCQEHVAPMASLGFALELTEGDAPVFGRYEGGNLSSGVRMLVERQKFGRGWRVGRKEWAESDKGEWKWCLRWVAGVDKGQAVRQHALLFESPIAAATFGEIENWGRP